MHIIHINELRHNCINCVRIELSNLKYKFIFSLKVQVYEELRGYKKTPIKNDDESSSVAEADKISNLKLVEDIYKILIFMDSENSV